MSEVTQIVVGCAIGSLGGLAITTVFAVLLCRNFDAVMDFLDGKK